MLEIDKYIPKCYLFKIRSYYFLIFNYTLVIVLPFTYFIILSFYLNYYYQGRTLGVTLGCFLGMFPLLLKKDEESMDEKSEEEEDEK